MIDVSTREYMSVMREMTDQGHEISMTIVGTSMEPFLVHMRDKICFRKPERPLKKGDMVFYQRMSGEYVMHRIHRIEKNGYYLAGDHQTTLEGPIHRKQIFAIVTEAERNGMWIDQGDRVWKFYAGCWRKLFWVRKMINKLKRIIQK